MTLTREQILSLTGPALSEAVAMHVMECERIPINFAHGSAWFDAKSRCYFVPNAENDGLGSTACGAINVHDYLGRDFRLMSFPVFEPHRDIRHAWDIFQVRRQKIFSKRTAFFRELGHLLQTRSGPHEANCVKVAWPDAMMFLTPEIICHGALLAAQFDTEPMPELHKKQP